VPTPDVTGQCSSFTQKSERVKKKMVKFTSIKIPVYPLHTTYNNEDLNVTENVKFLGMYLDCHLTWKQHTDKSVKKIEYDLLHA
jgi:hypothetical protein